MRTYSYYRLLILWQMRMFRRKQHILLVALILGCMLWYQYGHLPGSYTSPSSVTCLGELESPESWQKPPELPLHLQNSSQDDPALISHICQHWLIPPSSKPLNLTKPDLTHYAQNGQSQLVDSILKQRTGGFFVEAGAYDGEYLSNSLFFEKSRQWTGLLVEGNENVFKTMLYRNRHAYLVDGCMSLEKRPMVGTFVVRDDVFGGVEEGMSESHKRRIGLGRKKDTQRVQCFPLFSILAAIGVKHVDYFSLDIEGAEVEVLTTLPLDQITVDVFSIEYVVGGLDGSNKESQTKLKEITDHLVGKHGYKVVKISPTEDVILMKRNV